MNKALNLLKLNNILIIKYLMVNLWIINLYILMGDGDVKNRVLWTLQQLIERINDNENYEWDKHDDVTCILVYDLDGAFGVDEESSNTLRQLYTYDSVVQKAA
eukprot:166252_1